MKLLDGDVAYRCCLQKSMPSGGKAQIQKDRFVFPTDLGAFLIYLFRKKLVIPTDQATFLLLCLRLLVKLFVTYTESTQCVSTVYTVVINLTPAPSPLLQRTGTVVDALKPALCPAGGSVSKYLLHKPEDLGLNPQPWVKRCTWGHIYSPRSGRGQQIPLLSLAELLS